LLQATALNIFWADRTGGGIEQLPFLAGQLYQRTLSGVSLDEAVLPVSREHGLYSHR
jgi:hypothetical protein